MNEKKNRSEISDTEDFKLIRAFLDDDKKAFDALVIKYKDRVFNLCYRFLGNYDEADDAAQETFVKVFKGLDKFQFKSSFFTWMYRIAMNTCKNKTVSMKYRFHKHMIPLDKPRTMDHEAAPIEIEDNKHSPEKMLERKEREYFIYKAINSLPGKQKRLIVLRDIEGLPYEEIVEITGYKLGTVKSKLARARESLRAKLKGVF